METYSNFFDALKSWAKNSSIEEVNCLYFKINILIDIKKDKNAAIQLLSDYFKSGTLFAESFLDAYYKLDEVPETKRKINNV